MNFQVKDTTSSMRTEDEETPGDLRVGDYVLAKQDRQNKLTATFSETTYTVTERNNSRVTATNKQRYSYT